MKDIKRDPVLEAADASPYRAEKETKVQAERRQVLVPDQGCRAMDLLPGHVAWHEGEEVFLCFHTYTDDKEKRVITSWVAPLTPKKRGRGIHLIPLEPDEPMVYRRGNVIGVEDKR